MSFFEIGAEQSTEFDDSLLYDLVIIGGGPAGLTAGIYAARGGLKTLIIEQRVEGGTLNFTPVIENYPPFSSITGLELAQKWVEHASSAGVLFLKEAVVRVLITDEIQSVWTERQSHVQARAMFISTGSSYRELGIPSEKRLLGKGVSYCAICDGALFKGKKIAVVGGGNSAVDEALYLSQMAGSVTIIHRRDQLRAEKALAQKALQHPKIRLYWDTVVTEIRGERKVESLLLENIHTRKTQIEDFDGVFIYVGLQPRSELFTAQVDSTPDGFILTHPDTLETSRKKVFAIGDVRKKEIRQIITAAADGALAACMLIKKYFL